MDSSGCEFLPVALGGRLDCSVFDCFVFDCLRCRSPNNALAILARSSSNRHENALERMVSAPTATTMMKGPTNWDRFPVPLGELLLLDGAPRNSSGVLDKADTR